jgi:hypothetical protein
VSLTGLPLILLTWVLVIVAVVATVRWWRLSGRRRVPVRVGGLVLIELLVVAGVGLIVNREDSFYPSWQALGGLRNSVTVPSAPTGRLDGKLDGHVPVTWSPPEAAGWHLAGPPLLIAPADYAAQPDRTFPIVIVLTAATDIRPASDAVTVVLHPTPRTNVLSTPGKGPSPGAPAHPTPSRSPSARTNVLSTQTASPPGARPGSSSGGQNVRSTQPGTVPGAPPAGATGSSPGARPGGSSGGQNVRSTQPGTVPGARPTGATGSSPGARPGGSPGGQNVRSTQPGTPPTSPPGNPPGNPSGGTNVLSALPDLLARDARVTNSVVILADPEWLALAKTWPGHPPVIAGHDGPAFEKAARDLPAPLAAPQKLPS